MLNTWKYYTSGTWLNLAELDDFGFPVDGEFDFEANFGCSHAHVTESGAAICARLGRWPLVLTVIEVRDSRDGSLADVQILHVDNCFGTSKMVAERATPESTKTLHWVEWMYLRPLQKYSLENCNVWRDDRGPMMIDLDPLPAEDDADEWPLLSPSLIDLVARYEISPGIALHLIKATQYLGLARRRRAHRLPRAKVIEALYVCGRWRGRLAKQISAVNASATPGIQTKVDGYMAAARWLGFPCHTFEQLTRERRASDKSNRAGSGPVSTIEHPG